MAKPVPAAEARTDRGTPPVTRLPGKLILILATGLFFLPFWPITAAEITIPEIEMASRGRMDDGKFVLTSVLYADLALTGGYKYAFLLGFSLEVDTADYTKAVPGFRIAKATARDLFNLPLELSYFLGSDDDFCTGEEFPDRFGISRFGTEFKGFFYFPEGIGGNLSRRYNGIHGVRGTGLSFSLTKWDKIIPIFYVYQHFDDIDNLIGGNISIYSGDLRMGRQDPVYTTELSNSGGNDRVFYRRQDGILK